MNATEEIRNAVDQLQGSEIGEEALAMLHDWLRKGRGLSLDTQNIDAIYTLLKHAWGSMAGTTLEALENALKSSN